MTPETRHGAPFELLRFTAAPVGVDVGVVELEGRLPLRGRFPRQPVLVVEHGAGPRAEHAPVHATRDGDVWSAVYAVPVRALDGGRFALGLRGTLLELPAPDPADDGDRLAALGREANALRRRLEAAEDAAAAALEEAGAATAELGAAVMAARDAEQAASAERIAALEAELAEARRQAARDVEEARAEVAAAQEAAVAAAIARGQDAEQRAEAARAEADAAAAARVEAAQRAEDAERRAADAEQRVADAEQRVEQAERRAEAEHEDGDARAGAAERRAQTAEELAEASEAGVDVLRAELAEERERSQAIIAELQAQLDGARAGRGDEPTAVAEPRDDPPTRPQRVAAAADAPAATPTPTPAPAPLKRPTRLATAPRDEPVRDASGSAASRLVAIGALLLFLFVLLGLLLGFLG